MAQFDELLKDKDFLKLHEEVNSINIFDILKISATEIRHSVFLAWLLNPNENHGFGSLFLKKFLGLIRGINFEQCDYEKVEIRREWKNIDLLLIVNEPNNRYIIAIENKIYSAENNKQLKTYSDTISKEFHNNEHIYKLYLVPDNNLNNRGDDKSDKWEDLLYSKITFILKELLDENRGKHDEFTIKLIEQYYKILTTIIDMEDKEELNKLSANLWRKYEKTLNVLLSYKQNRINQLFESLCKNIKDEVVFKSKIWFKTKKMNDYFNNNNNKDILNYQIYKSQNVIELYLFLGVGDTLVRQQTFDILNKSEFIMNYKKFSEMPKGQYNIILRLLLIEINLNKDDDIDSQKIELKNSWDNAYKDLKMIDNLFENKTTSA